MADQLPDNLPTLRWALMTPTQADDLLLQNTSNRKFSARHLAEMAHDMTAGLWNPYACVTIIVAQDGTLLNGQHTLAAIVQSGIAQPVVLIEGVPAETDPWLTIDNTHKRTLAQELSRDNVSNAGLCAAIANNLWRYEHAEAIAGRAAPSNMAARHIWEAKRSQIEERATDAKRIARATKFSSASVLGTVYVLVDEMNPDAAAAFFGRLDEGGVGQKGDRDPIAQFTRRTDAINRARHHHARHGVDNELDAGWLILTYNAFRTGDRRVISHHVRSDGTLPRQPLLLTEEDVAEIVDLEAPDRAPDLFQ